MPTLRVNGRRVTVGEDATILDAAREAGIEVGMERTQPEGPGSLHPGLTEVAN